MRNIITLAATLLTGAMAGAASAALYDDAVLEQAYRKTARNIELMVTEDIVRTVPRSVRPQAAAIRSEFVLRGPNPLAFWSDPFNRVVYIPMESIRFIDDLAILQAWFDRHGCNAAYIHSYLWALLRQQRPLTSPLAAFGVNRERALADRYVDDVSGKILKSSVLFVLAHEVGHILLGHRGGLTGRASQRQEREADDFAMDHFAAIGAPPAGMVYYFIASRWRDPVGTAASRGTHPVSPERIGAVAERLAQDPGAFSFSEPNPARGRTQVMSIARDMQRVAELSSDERLLTLLPMGLEAEFPLSRLRTACPG